VRVEGRELRGARNWAQGAVQFGKAMQHARSALVDGAVGLLMEPHGKLLRALTFTFADGKIVAADIIAEPERLAALEISALD